MAAPNAALNTRPSTKTLPTDEELVKRVVAGDPAPFELLYARYFPRVFRFVDRRVSNRADSEEIVQEVFFNLFSSLHSFRGDAPFAAWVFGLTRCTIASRFKRKRPDTVPMPDEDQPLDAPVATTANPHEDYELTERLGRLSTAARRDLSEEQWRLFQLHHLEDRSIQEIAGMVAKSEDAVKSHLYRARRLLLAR
ncbi:MAG: hypothetical protein CL910_03670 [Deltaproteobacteria bacterium]|jgi:RNA polymerase sigma-70 factor (ECF subfamily)|nr:hypothetical protein [Deltaproteobacteria bacterium]